jgi:hypothetical protein
MKRYMAFAGVEFEPNGGMADCYGQFATVEEARAALANEDKDWSIDDDGLLPFQTKPLRYDVFDSSCPCWAYAACWVVGIGQSDEDEPLPDWPIEFTTGAPSRGYSVVLNIEVPDDTVMVELNRDNRYR